MSELNGNTNSNYSYWMTNKVVFPWKGILWGAIRGSEKKHWMVQNGTEGFEKSLEEQQLYAQELNLSFPVANTSDKVEVFELSWIWIEMNCSIGYFR